MKGRSWAWLVLGVGVLAIAGYAEAQEDPLLERAKTFFKPLPEPKNAPFPKENPTTPEKVALGKLLYNDPRLSKSHAISCASCHNLGLYGADGRSVSVGHKGKTGVRNSNSSLNADFQVAQFWDGRAKNLEEQALGPMVNPVEMANDSHEDVVKTLRSIPGYMEPFKKAFPDEKSPITIQNAVRAIAAFERTLTTPSRFDAFLKGDIKALTAKEREGLSLFMDRGCKTCHNGIGVGGGMFQKIGVIKPNPNTKDLGRYVVTKNEADRYVFKVPILRNVAETAPYFHDGSVWGLQEAVKMMAELQLGLRLNQDEIGKIAAFLESLTGDLPMEALILPVFPRSGKETPRPKG